MYGELVALLRLLFCWTFPFCCGELLCPFSILVIGLTVVGSWCCCSCCFCLVKLFANMLWYDGRSVAASFVSPLVVGIIAWYLLLFPLDKLVVCSWLLDVILLINCNYSIYHCIWNNISQNVLFHNKCNIVIPWLQSRLIMWWRCSIVSNTSWLHSFVTNLRIPSFNKIFIQVAFLFTFLWHWK